jgi:PAS domain S-box-containing protein
VSELREIGGDIERALETVNVPSYVIDPTGIIRWINPAARRLVGDVRGRQFTSVVAHEDTRRAREHFARKIAGTAQVTDAQVVLVDPDGGRVQVDISSCPLMQGHRVIGVFGQMSDIEEQPDDPLPPHLTPRQTEVLRLLKRGRSTEQIAQELHLSTETVRNHVRHLLRALGVHTRLEAVAVARRRISSLTAAARACRSVAVRTSAGRVIAIRWSDETVSLHDVDAALEMESNCENVCWSDPVFDSSQQLVELADPFWCVDDDEGHVKAGLDPASPARLQRPEEVRRAL